MSTEDQASPDKQAVIGNRAMEIIVALLLLAFGAVIAWTSFKLGAKWGDDGPQAGYFPFYIGVIIAISSVVTLVQALRGTTGQSRGTFVERGQLKQVLAVLIPAIVFVLAIQWFGIYLAATVYIAVFMIWLGQYAWWKAVLLGVTVSVCVYLMFEVWFKVALHKGSLYDPLSLIGL
ncbi:MAG: tripartite tricarboxylate transporter TctB family protein [Betaproteobacteria bacterium]|nr:tripartite tricarboxylate transporter TctB family protein [Betaproteobacteria bacterium]